jgi:hypothetical protein
MRKLSPSTSPSHYTTGPDTAKHDVDDFRLWLVTEIHHFGEMLIDPENPGPSVLQVQGNSLFYLRSVNSIQPLEGNSAM